MRNPHALFRRHCILIANKRGFTVLPDTLQGVEPPDPRKEEALGKTGCIIPKSNGAIHLHPVRGRIAGYPMTYHGTTKQHCCNA